jgi:hypothetical protein
MLCCSSQCPKYKECGRAIINNENCFEQVENLYSHGWCSISGKSDGTVEYTSHSDCGPCGNYAMFYPRGN